MSENCAQLVQSNSTAQAGSDLPRTIEKYRPLRNGRFIVTATPVSIAIGRMRASASGSSGDRLTCRKSIVPVRITCIIMS